MDNNRFFFCNFIDIDYKMTNNRLLSMQPQCGQSRVSALYSHEQIGTKNALLQKNAFLKKCIIMKSSPSFALF